MADTYRFVAEVPGVRLDKSIAERTGLPRARVQTLIHDGHVAVNGRVARPSYKLQVGDRVDISIPPPQPTTLAAEQIPLSIVYEDDNLMVVDKPAGLTVHPAPGHPAGTLVNAILAHCPDLPGVGGSLRPGIVHRLDKDTSGLIIVAKNDATQVSLSTQMKARSIVKRYLVLVKGKLAPERGAIEAPVGRHPRHRQMMAVVSTGRPARTGYRVVKYLDGYTLVEATLETGRTHQIRVHFSAIGFPVAGDSTYGVRAPFLKRQFVHARYLRFRLPDIGEWREFEAPLPDDLKHALASLGAKADF